MTPQTPLRSEAWVVAVIGPESSGKTTLSRELAVHLDAAWVPEAARDYVDGLDRPVVASDLLQIAQAQVSLEDRARQQHDRVVVDTDLIVMEVWSRWAHGSVDPWIEQDLITRRYDLTLLLAPDLPWTFDPLREHPDPEDRQRIHDAYRALLERLDRPWAAVEGTGPARLRNALDAIRRHGGPVPKDSPPTP